jgi:hypothetical protein
VQSRDRENARFGEGGEYRGEGQRSDPPALVADQQLQL